MSLTAALDAQEKRLVAEHGKVSEYDTLLRQVAERARDTSWEGSFVLPAAPATGVARLVLPELPEGSGWVLGAAADVQAKLATTGTSGTTQVRLVNGASDVADLDVANTDSDDTFVNGSSISTAVIPGGTTLTFDVDAVATAAVGPISVRIRLNVQPIVVTDEIEDLQ